MRFRFKSNFKGYLYVINHSTSGTSTLMFPRQDTGSMNQIEAGKEYVVPATKVRSAWKARKGTTLSRGW